MEYLVCKFKDNGSMFITTRKSRETMISVLSGLGQEIDSIVLKTFEHYRSAVDYHKQMESIDKKIKDL